MKSLTPTAATLTVQTVKLYNPSGMADRLVVVHLSNGSTVDVRLNNSGEIDQPGACSCQVQAVAAVSTKYANWLRGRRRPVALPGIETAEINRCAGWRMWQRGQ